MKEKIIKFLQSGPKTFEELKTEFNLLSYSDSKKLDKTLRELWNEKKVFYKKTKNTYNLKNDEEIIGTFRETKNDYGFVENETITIFIPGKFVLNALSGDTVKVILFPLRDIDEKDRRSGKIVRVMQRNGSAIVGRVSIVDNKKTFVPDELTPKHEYLLEDLNKYNEGDVIVTKFSDFANGKIDLKIVKLIGSEKDANLDSEIIAYKFNLKKDFSKEVKKESLEIVSKDSERRIDITDRMVYTIDGSESKDLDDAIDLTILSNGNYRLGVHIADVSHFVKEDSEIDKEALERGTSVYLIDTVFPMLPKYLSDEMCSLNPNTLKFTLSCDMQIDKNGKIINTKIYESKIISKHRLTYEQVDQLYDGKTKEIINSDLTESLLHAKELAYILRKVKISNGMIDFALPEAKIKLDENGEVVEIKNKLQTESEKVIEDLMVVTNETIANMLYTKNLPGIFRVHPKPKEENIETFKNLSRTLGVFLSKSSSEITSNDLMNFIEKQKNTENEDLFKRYMIQTMEKAIYQYEDNGHYALGLKHYLHFTSPIRRYPDLIVHRLMKKYFLDKDSLLNISNSKDLIPYLEFVSKLTSEKERMSVSSERKLMDIKKSRFMKNSIGQILKGKIVSVVRFGFFVEFDNLTQGLVHIDSLVDDEYMYDEIKFSIIGNKNKKIFKLGEKIDVKLINVDIIRGLIDLAIA